MKLIENGDLVFLERPAGATGDDGKPLSNYNAGEYIVVRATCNNLYCVSLKSGYELAHQKAFPLVGRDRWEVVSVQQGRREVRDAISFCLRFEEERHAEKKQWLDYIYDQAQQTRLKLTEILRDRWGESAGVTPPAPSPVGDGIYIKGVFYPCPPSHVARFILA